MWKTEPALLFVSKHPCRRGLAPGLLTLAS